MSKDDAQEMDERELARRLGSAFAETEPDADFDAAAELRALGLDPDQVAARMKRVAGRARLERRARRLRSFLARRIDHLLEGLDSLLPLAPAPAAVLRGGAHAPRSSADPRLEEAVALLGNGAYDQAKTRLDDLIADHGRQEIYLWLLAHAELGRGEIGCARASLAAIEGELAPRARELLEAIEGEGL